MESTAKTGTRTSRRCESESLNLPPGTFSVNQFVTTVVSPQTRFRNYRSQKKWGERADLRCYSSYRLVNDFCLQVLEQCRARRERSGAYGSSSNRFCY